MINLKTLLELYMHNKTGCDHNKFYVGGFEKFETKFDKNGFQIGGKNTWVSKLIYSGVITRGI